MNTTTTSFKISTAVLAAAVLATVPASAALATSVKEQNKSEKNHTSYWEAKGFGTCVKVDGVNSKTYTVPTLSDSKVYTLAVVKSGSESSVDNPHEQNNSVNSNDTLTHSSGKDISHVILCQKTAAVTTTPVEESDATVSAGQGQGEDEGQVLSGASTTRPETVAVPTTLPKTGMSQVISTIAALFASAAAYATTLRLQRTR